MIILRGRSVDDARKIAGWLNDHVAPGDCNKPTHVSVISRTLYWNSWDKASWEVKLFDVPKELRVTGVPDESKIIFLLRFTQ